MESLLIIYIFILLREIAIHRESYKLEGTIRWLLRCSYSNHFITIDVFIISYWQTNSFMDRFFLQNTTVALKYDHVI